MSEKYLEDLKNIDKVQGLIYQNLMGAFNELENNVHVNFDDTHQIASLQQLKQVILTRLKNSLAYVNSEDFKNACITCSATRLLALLKHKISNEYLTEEAREKASEEAIIEYKMDKTYVYRYNEIVNSLKEHISKFLTSKQLRKQFQIDSFILSHLKKEKNAIDNTFPEEGNINEPEWLKNMDQDALDNLTIEIISKLEKQDYQGLLQFINNNNYY